jgi:outer membrane receptor protein involved in Fe transport
MLGSEAQDHYHVAQEGLDLTGDGSQPFLSSETPYRFYAGYALADWFVTPAVHLSAGVRLDSYSTFGSSVNPRLALIWKPTDKEVFKLMAGSAFRAPSIYELYYNDGGVTVVPACATSTNCSALQAEKVRSAELEWTHHFDPVWSLLASGWATRIDNTIDLLQAPGQPIGVSQYQNTGAPIDGLGAELELRREWRQGWMIEANGSVQKLWFDQGSNPAAPLGEVPDSPSLQAGAKVAMPLIPRLLTLMTRVSIEGPRWDRDDEPGDPPQQQTPYGFIWDASISGQLPDWHLRGSVGIYNIANWQYTYPLSREFGPQIQSPQSGRRLLANLTFTF